MKRRLILFALGLLAASTANAADGPFPFVARPAGVFSVPGDDAMLMPTAVAIDAEGRVFVSDGVHNRIVVFSPDGEVLQKIESVGGSPLVRPNGLHFDAQGRLWIADTGNARAVARNPDGTLALEVAWPASDGDPADITDALLGSDGTTVWLVDNEHDRIGRFDLRSGTFSTMGQYGSSLGEFSHPFMITPGNDGDVFVTDVLNHRAQLINAKGRAAGSLGRFGVGLGEFFRPKDLATGPNGNIWIVDGTMGVVQIFHPVGTLLGVVRDEQGAPLKLDTPCGIALDTDGNLYVTELLPSRVRKFVIERNPGAPPPQVQQSPTVGKQPATCVLCHIEWVKPLVDGKSTVLMSPPPNPTDWPNVSRAPMCLSCHDTSIADSRLRVWGRHGHPTMVKLGEGMAAPENLPLVEGQVACRTCHSAHATALTTLDISRIVFLRQSPERMCTSCHAAKTRGPQAHQHPIGEIPAYTTGAPRATTCQSCHAAHGATAEHMLVASPNTNQLCLPCHGAYQPDRFGDSAGGNHPLGTLQVAAEVAESARKAGVALTDDRSAVCLSCHQIHSASQDHFLLQVPLTDSTLCRGCHSEPAAVVKTPHNLVTSHPEAEAQIGLSFADGGPCSACHRFHGELRWKASSPIDPNGKCIRCHEAGGLAADKSLPPKNHPEAQCVDCHSPHDNTRGHFFAVQPEKRCAQCHDEKLRLTGGPHDMEAKPAVWPKVSEKTGDTCLACHRAHASPTTGLFRVVAAKASTDVEATCQGCHANTAPGSASHVALMHPREIQDTAKLHALPIFVDPQGKPELTCSTCHDPHRGPNDAPRLLRVAAGQTGEDMCITCHTARANIHMIGHAQEPLREAGFQAGGCKPCHQIHANPKDVEPNIMWPKKMSEFEGVEEVPKANVHCRACHRVGGPVAPPEIAFHPDEVMFNPIQPGEPGYMPLYNAQGEVDPQGHIACLTCHLTHGRSTPAPIPRGMIGVASRELRARQWHVRSFAANNLCTTCHGFDATRRFIYFHDPARRGGPLAGR